MRNNTALFFRNGALPVPRAVRMMRIADNMGYYCKFIGAKREDLFSKKDQYDGFEVVRVGAKYPLLNGKRLFLYVVYTIFFTISLFLRFLKERPALLVASDFEAIIPAIIYSKLFRTRLIYNIHDNISQRYNLPTVLNKILNLLEGSAVKCCESSMVPEGFRRESLPKWCHHKVHIVRNVPENVNYVKPDLASDKIKIFYGGWLNPTRGINALIKLAEENDDFEVTIAGTGTSDMIKKLNSSDKLNFLGQIDHKSSLELTANSHFIPIYYDPQIIINRYAASNKLAETLAIGRPLLVNEELVILESFYNKDSIIASAYSDFQSVPKKIREVFYNKDRYLKLCESSREIYEKHYSWDDAKLKMEQLIDY